MAAVSPGGSVPDLSSAPVPAPRLHLRARHLGAAGRPAGARCASTSTRWCCRSWCSWSWRPSATTPSWAGRPARRCAAGAAARSRTARSTEPLPVNDARRHAAGRAQPPGHRRPAGGAAPPTTTTTASWPSPSNLADEGHDVTVVTKDLPLRLKASIVGLDADEYRNELAGDTSWTGFVELDVDADRHRRAVRRAGRRPRRGPGPAVQHRRRPRARARSRRSAGSTTTSASTSSRGDRALFDVRGPLAPSSASPSTCWPTRAVGIVSLGGPAGTGKSVLALAAGLDAVLEQRTHKRVVVFRPLFAVGGQDLGFLPGDRGREDGAVGGRGHRRARGDRRPRGRSRRSLARDLLEVLPLTHIRGRSLTDTFVIIDEAQNLERAVLLTALSRLGEGSRVVLTHDVAQRDNLRVGRHDGIASVIDALARPPAVRATSPSPAPSAARSPRSSPRCSTTRSADGRRRQPTGTWNEADVSSNRDTRALITIVHVPG